MLHKSIRWRIQAWHGFLLSCVVIALMIAFYAYESHQRFSELDSQLRMAGQVLMPRLAPPGPMRGNRLGPGHPSGGPAQRGESFDGDPRVLNEARLIETGIYYIGWQENGEIVERSANAPTDLQYQDINAERPFTRSRGGNREFINVTPRGEVVLAGTSEANVVHALRRLAFLLAATAVAIVGAGLTVGWWIAGNALRPIADISATAEKIISGDVAKRIKIPSGDNELAQLATVLNHTFDKFEQMIDEQLRFTADASHELRTPIAVLITQIQLALSRERTGQEYRTTLETCERAAERLRVLVNQLIELARIDAGDASLVWEKCDLSRVARDAVEFITPLAEKKKVTLHHSIDSVRLKADVMKLGQVLINLLNNAIHHNKEGIEVSLSVRREADKAVIRVSDTGAGIPADALPHLFDRFYRVDKARARGKGNSGLGLAICKAIVEGHGGTIRAESEVGKGTDFIIELPAARITSDSISS